MKGLMIKDLQLVFSNKTTLPIFILLTVMLLVTGNADTVYFVIAYFTMLCGIMIISTINYDELDNSGAFLMTMPVTREMYVIEKYLLTFFGVLTGWIISFIICWIFSSIRNYPMDILESATGSLAVALVLYMMLTVLIPIQLKFGNTKSRIMMIIIVAVAIILGSTGASIAKSSNIDMQGMEDKINQFITQTSLPVLILMGVAIVAIITLISGRISIGIIRKKQY